MASFRSVVDRTILVTDIPYLTDDNDQLTDKLTIHFGKGQNGGGEVQMVICPFGGTLDKGLLVFESESVVHTVLNHTHHLEDKPIQVHRLPPVCAEITGYIDDFFWDVLPKDKAKKVASHLYQLLGKEKVKLSNLKVSECIGSLDQVEEVERCLAEAVGLVGGNTESDLTHVIKRSVHIENITFMTDDIGQLKEELQIYMQKAGVELETLICAIKGDFQRAIAIFKSVQDCNRFLNLGVHTFFDETLHVEKLPKVFKKMVATIDEFYLKSISRSKLKTLVEFLQGRFGPDFTNTGQELNGNCQQICEATILVVEAIGLVTTDHTETVSKTASEEKESLQSLKDNPENFASPIGCQEIQPSNRKLTTKADVSETGSLRTNYQHKVPGMARPVRDTRIGQESNKGRHCDKSYTTLGSGMSDHPNHQPSEAQIKDGKIKPTDTPKAKYDPSKYTSGKTVSSWEAKHHPDDDDDDDQTNPIKIVDDHFSHSIGHGFPVSYVSANGKNPTDHFSTDKANRTEHDTPSIDHPRVNNYFITVDKMIFHYMKVNHKDDMDKFKRNHNVKIKVSTEESSDQNKQYIELQAKQDTDISKAQEEFVRLYSRIHIKTKKKTVPFGSVDEKKLIEVQAKMKKRFPTVIVAWGDEMQCTLCGERTAVETAAHELSQSILEDEVFSVDKITVEYLSVVHKHKMRDLENKYSIILEIQEDASKDPNQQAIHIKPCKGFFKRCSSEDLVKAKDEFISFYQETFFSIKRTSVSCQDVSRKAVANAVKGTMKIFPNVLITQEEANDDIIICAKESDTEAVVREFTNLAGLMPKRRLRKQKSNDPEQPSQTTQCTTVALAQSESKQLATNFVTAEGLQIILITGDITKQRVDVIVNAANRHLSHDGGVAKAISVAAGPKLQNECYYILRGGNCLSVGKCLDTNSYNLNCDRVVHAVGPRYQDDTTNFMSLLTQTFSNALRRTDTIICAQSVAIPLISSGTFGGPKQSCVNALTTALWNFSKSQTVRNLQRVFLVNIDEETTHILQQTCSEVFLPTTQPELKLYADFPPTNNTSMAKYKPCHEFEVIVETGDITQSTVDVIVNAANKDLRHARGVAGAISKAAGKELQEECKRIMRHRQPLQTEEYVVTDGYKLQCKILHTVGPIYDKRSSDGEFQLALKNTFLSVLRYANLPIEAKAIAIPLVSSGIYGGPKEMCATALLSAVEEFSKERHLIIKTIHLINLDEESTRTLQDAFSRRYSEGSVENPVSRAPTFCVGLKHKTMHGIRLCVAEGDITEQDVDIIVNPTDGYLRNLVGVAKAISTAAGRKLQEQCEHVMNERNHVDVKIGEVIVTDGCGLKCKHVLHTASPIYTGGYSESSRAKYHETLLQTFQACLYIANNTEGTRSIALPLIGSGNNGAPQQLCADALARAIKMFDEREDRFFLKKITIVSINKEAISAVEMALNDHFVSHTSNTETLDSVPPIDLLPTDAFETDEGMLLVNQHGNIASQKADVIVNCTDERLQNKEGVSMMISEAAGSEFNKECRDFIKNRKSPLKPGEIITTKGCQLQCLHLLHVIDPLKEDIKPLLLKILLHSGTALSAKTIILPMFGCTSGGAYFEIYAQATALTVKRFSQMNTSVQNITFVNADARASTELSKALSCTFKRASQSPADLNNDHSYRHGNHDVGDCSESLKEVRIGYQSNALVAGAVPKHRGRQASTINQKLGHRQDFSVSNVQQSNLSGGFGKPVGMFGYGGTTSLHSHEVQNNPTKKTHSSLGSASRTISHPENQVNDNQPSCQKCWTKHDVKHLEACGHAFCTKCITRYIDSTCLSCGSLYCVVKEQKMQGTMTYFIQMDVDLMGEIGNGAIVIIYEFPSGTLGLKDLFPGRQYRGNKFTAYLPNNQEGLETVWLLRTAFIAGLTFSVKPTRSGVLAVTWSGLISHKRNTRGGIGNHGFPDPSYLKMVKEELKKQRIVSSLV